MFKKSKIKIVASIMVIMTLLIVGTIAVIYFSSYREMAQKDDHMLEHYVQVHAGEHFNMEETKNDRDTPPPLPEDERAYDIATIYSVTIHGDNQIGRIDNTKEYISNEELTNMALLVLQSGKDKGKIDGYNYVVKKNKDRTLIAFMDCSNFDKSITTLLKYTMIFGGIALLVVFIISVWLANVIIRPLEKNYNMQKQFVSDAGHELKTPVTVIATNAEVLSDELGGNKWLDNIIYENEKMSYLIKQLVELTRTEKREIAFEKVDFSHIAIGEILPFESMAFEKGIEIQYEEIDEHIVVNGNATQLGQLVSIMVDNAIAYVTGDRVEVALSRTKGKVILTVTNDAEQISKEQCEMLFERFYRADHARNSEGDHYGLGLAIAKSIVDAHKGEIGVDYQDGKVIFKITFKEAK